MMPIREAVLEVLESGVDDETLIQKLNHIAVDNGPQTYSTILHVLTHLAMETDEAQSCWQNIVAHHGKLKSALKRDVNLRTAICDYFCTIKHSLKNPKVVEIRIFESTVKASRFDSLTGLYNRQFFDEVLKREIKRAKRHGQELSILFFDLDDFKAINDAYGHQAGDAALTRAAQIILQETRSEDTAARYGGEELVIILPETDKMSALVLGERIRRRIETSHLKYGNTELAFTISGGLASYPVNALEADDLVKCADHALYRAKGSGKNNIAFFSRDKRRYLRIDLNQKVRVRPLGREDNLSQIAQGKNICMGGILFENEAVIPIGTKVQIDILTAEDKQLLIIGTVVRVEAYGSGLYDIGVQISFQELDKAVRNEISRWLQMKRRDEITPENN
jgi:diguanylate cyclase (GGDEF)-like protein